MVTKVTHTHTHTHTIGKLKKKNINSQEANKRMVNSKSNTEILLFTKLKWTLLYHNVEYRQEFKEMGIFICC